MASRHLKPDQRSSRANVVLMIVVALAFAAVSAAVVSQLVTGGAAQVAQAPQPAPVAPQPISQEGRIIAVTPTSVTARSVDGFARTYVVDSQTNAITTMGSTVGGTATAFAVNDEVAIVGVVRNGTAVATAVAQKRVSNLDGPPMDGL